MSVHTHAPEKGDINQDGYPDLAVGAYGSGTAGEAYVVFPSLTGTPPPSPVPTPAPTPAPHRIPDGLTPAPTVNFLADGVVGGGTIYEAPGVFVRAQELGGEVKYVQRDHGLWRSPKGSGDEDAGDEIV